MAKRRDDDILDVPPLANAMFAGEQAAATLAQQGIPGPANAIALARSLRAQGASAREIHARTSDVLKGTPYAGVHFAADGQPLFEIDDSRAKLRKGAVAKGSAYMGDVLDHSELYKAVKGSAMPTVAVSPDSNNSSYYGGAQHIDVGKKHATKLGKSNVLRDTAKGPLLHEAQHVVAELHGLPQGAHPDDYKPLYPGDSAEAKAKRIDAYRKTAGEQLAEATRKRETLTAEERRQLPPAEEPWMDPVKSHRRPPSDPQRKQAFISDLADVAVDAWKRATTREIVEGRPIHQRRIDPRKVAADPEAFQFKSGGDAAGVTERLKGVTQWDPLAAGKQVVFQRANGEYVIADGHQRRGLALRAIEKGQKGVALDAFVLREKDGWTPRDVRAYAALKNMKESSGNALDMAKVMRERPDLVNKSLPMSDAKIREAIALSKLSPKAFDMVVGGAIKPEHAAAVGANVGETSRHADMLTEMAKAGMRSAEHARLYVSQAMAAPSISETTGSLFGDETKVRSLLAERAKVLDRALSALKNDKRIFAMLEREAANIEAAGNKLAHASNLEKADTSGRLVELVEKLSTTRGPVSEMLDKAALALAEGKTPSQASTAFVNDVRRTMKDGGINGLMGNVQPVAAPVDPNQMGMFGDEAPGKPQGWSDEARAASAEARKANAKGDLFRTKKSAAYKYAAQGDDGGQVYFKSKKARDRFVQDGIQTSRENRIGRIQAMIEDGSPKPSKDIDASVAKGQNLKRASGAEAFADGWKAAKDGRRLAAGTDPDFAAGYRQYQTDKSPRAAERAMVEYLAGQNVPGTQEVTLAGSTKPDKQGSFLPDATTKEKIAAAAKAKGRPTVAQQPMDDGMFGSGMNQTDLVEMAKETKEQRAARMAEVERRHLQDRGVVPKSGVTYSAEQAERDRVAAGTKRAGDTATDRYSRSMANHPKRSMATAMSTVTIKPVVGPNGTTGEYQIVEDHFVGRGDRGQRKVGSTTYSERYASYEDAAKFINGLPDPAPSSLPQKPSRAAAVDQIKGELQEMFSRSPDGKQNRTDGTPLPERHNAALTQTENSGKPAGWSDEARKASAEVRAAKPLKDMTVKELRAEAKAKGVSLGGAKTKAAIASKISKANKGIVAGVSADNPWPSSMTTVAPRNVEKAAAAAKAAAAFDPHAVGLVPTAQREGPAGLARVIGGMTAEQARATAKAQGIHVPASIKTDAGVREFVARATFKQMADRRAAAGGDPSKMTAMADEAGNALRGTQNAANREAIAKNRKAKVKDLPREAAIARFSELMNGKPNGPWTTREINRAIRDQEATLARRAAGKDAAWSKAMAAASEPHAITTKPPHRADAQHQAALTQTQNQPPAAEPAKPAPKSKGKGRAGKVAGLAVGPVALGAGIAAAAVIAANTSAEAGQSTAKQAASATVAAAQAAAPVAVIGGGLAAGVKLGLMTAGRAALVGTGIGAVAIGISAAAYGAQAAKEGKGKLGIAKAAAWGAINGVVPIDAVRDATRSTAARVSGTPARPSEKQMAGYVQANNAYERQQTMNTTQTDHSDRKPGWGPEARIAAAKARGADLPYGGNAAAAPGYIPPKAN